MNDRQSKDRLNANTGKRATTVGVKTADTPKIPTGMIDEATDLFATIEGDAAAVEQAKVNAARNRK